MYGKILWTSAFSINESVACNKQNPVHDRLGTPVRFVDENCLGAAFATYPQTVARSGHNFPTAS